jgi:hypothetical protein
MTMRREQLQRFEKVLKYASECEMCLAAGPTAARRRGCRRWECGLVILYCREGERPGWFAVYRDAEKKQQWKELSSEDEAVHFLISALRSLNRQVVISTHRYQESRLGTASSVKDTPEQMIRKRFESRGYKALRPDNGFPDFMFYKTSSSGLTPSDIRFVEVKGPGDEVRENQKAVHDILRLLGFQVSVYYLARAQDWDSERSCEVDVYEVSRVEGAEQESSVGHDDACPVRDARERGQSAFAQ